MILIHDDYADDGDDDDDDDGDDDDEDDDATKLTSSVSKLRPREPLRAPRPGPLDEWQQQSAHAEMPLLEAAKNRPYTQQLQSPT